MISKSKVTISTILPTENVLSLYEILKDESRYYCLNVKSVKEDKIVVGNESRREIVLLCYKENKEYFTSLIKKILKKVK